MTPPPTLPVVAPVVTAAPVVPEPVLVPLVVPALPVVAQAAPVVGAAGGALVNTAFLAHFRTLARGHFTVRRLERRYGAEAVRAAAAALGG